MYRYPAAGKADEHRQGHLVGYPWQDAEAAPDSCFWNCIVLNCIFASYELFLSLNSSIFPAAGEAYEHRQGHLVGHVGEEAEVTQNSSFWNCIELYFRIVLSIFVIKSIDIQRQEKLMNIDKGIWWDTLGKMQKLLRIAAQTCCMNGQITPEAMHNYFMSGGGDLLNIFFL